MHLPEWFRFLGKYYLVAYGAMLLAMIIAAPYGLIGAAERLRHRFFPAPSPTPPRASRPREIVAKPAAGLSASRRRIAAVTW